MLVKKHCTLSGLLGLCLGTTLPTAVTAYEKIVESANKMGTIVEIAVVSADSSPDRIAAAHSAIAQAFAEMDRLIAPLSGYAEDNDIAHINRSAGKAPVTVSSAVIEVAQHALTLAATSNGAFDPTYKPLGALWRVQNMKRPPTPAAIKAARALVNYQDVVVDFAAQSIFLRRPGMQLDLDGISKGYIVSKAAAKLRDLGFPCHLVSGSGDIQAGDAKPDSPWLIGIRHPRQPGSIVATLALSNTAVSTSGDYERFVVIGGRRYHHIIDPRTGHPCKGLQSATIIGPSTAQTDALDTAVFVLGVRKGLQLVSKQKQLAAIVIDSMGKLHQTPNAKNYIVPQAPLLTRKKAVTTQHSQPTP